ncbi:hypothetical protein Tco_1314238 [Tanacetum coccineum]
MMLKNGGLVREMEKSPLGRNLLRNSSIDSIPNHTMRKDEMLDGGDNWGIDPLEFLSNINTAFKSHKKVDGRTQKVIFHSWMNGNWDKRYVDNSILCNNERKESKYENPPNTATDSFFKAYDIRDIEKENGQGKIKHKDKDKDDKRPHKKICKTKKFEAIKYSLGPNEEYLAIRRCKYDI